MSRCRQCGDMRMRPTAIMRYPDGEQETKIGLDLIHSAQLDGAKLVSQTVERCPGQAHAIRITEDDG